METFGSITLSLDSNHEAPLNTGPTPYFKPSPTGLTTPYFPMAAAGLPTKLNTPPIAAPSAPNLNLFLNRAAAKSVPDKFSVSSSLRNKFARPGSEATKSVIAKAPPIVPDFAKIFVAVVPMYDAVAFFAF